MYDLIIIGGGPAGVSAGIYAARKKIKTLLVADSFGGQSLVSADIQNWIGEPSISGFDLAQNYIYIFGKISQIHKKARLISAFRLFSIVHTRLKSVISAGKLLGRE